MSGIYIHIPFCKQACNYCDFHFSTSLAKKDDMLKAICRELELRKQEFEKTRVQTIYFGGGTPSLLTSKELDTIFESITANYELASNLEITLEANPDDLTNDRLEQLSESPINRLSIGVQSFFEHDLKLMNRAHTTRQAKESIELSKNFFDNISIDLIYGVPEASDEQWLKNIQIALDFKLPHISSYALTVEPKTALEHYIKKGLIQEVDEEQTERQFKLLRSTLENHGFVHYELSNFGKEGYFSKNNTAYWQRKSYLGIGPSAHSYNGQSRSWNVRNNAQYIKNLTKGILPSSSELLTKTDHYNEMVMTGLRTMWGVSLLAVEQEIGVAFKRYLLEQATSFINQDLLYIENDTLKLQKEASFLSDGIAASLFKLNL